MPKSSQKTSDFTQREGKEKEQNAIFTDYSGAVNLLPGTAPVLGGGRERGLTETHSETFPPVRRTGAKEDVLVWTTALPRPL